MMEFYGREGIPLGTFFCFATPATPIGSVEALDAASAIKKAIEEFEITDPQKQKRLMALIKGAAM